MTTPRFVANSLARRALLSRQGLCRAPRVKIDAGALLGLIEEIGFVQVDSISTVERAHHLILFARNETYRPRLLARLLEEDRALFENWTHDASIIPSRFFPFWRPRFRREAERLRFVYRDWHGHDFEGHLADLVSHIEEQGPVMARDFNHLRPETARGWWDWHPAKTALEFLWRTGRLAVCHRKGFQKVYDLSERVIPAKHRAREIDTDQFVDWACDSALERLGIATAGELSAFWDSVSPAEAKNWSDRQLTAGLLCEVQVESTGDGAPRKALVRPDFLEDLENLPRAPARLRALSPFDPVVRDRKRLARLFGFDYRVEIFVPKSKRNYGYYVFPLLEGERFVGRIEMRLDKNRETLTLIALWPERGQRWGKGRQLALESELERHRRFVGTSRVVYSKDWLRTRL